MCVISKGYHICGGYGSRFSKLPLKELLSLVTWISWYLARSKQYVGCLDCTHLTQMPRDCFLLGKTKEPRLEPIMIPSKTRFIAYYTPRNYV